MPSLLHQYHLSYAAGGLLVLFQFIGFLMGVPAATLVMHRKGYKLLLISSALIIGIALSLLTMLPALPLVYFLCLANGFGIAAAETGVATYTMEVFLGRRAVVMSYLEVAFGLGALCMPALSSLLITWHSWPFVFLFAGILSLLAAARWSRLPLTADTSVQESERNSSTLDRSARLLQQESATARGGRRLLLVLFLGMIFLYVGIESSISSFLPSIFIPFLHEMPAVASLSVAIFWVSMVLGRAATGWIVRKVAYGQFLLWSVSGTVLLLYVLAQFDTAFAAYMTVFLVGLFMSGIYSVTLVYANHSIPQAARLVTGLITVAAGLGGAVIPPLVGIALDRSAPATVIELIALVAGILFLSLLAVLVLGKPRHPSRAKFPDDQTMATK